MNKLKVMGFTLSVDGFGAGPDQDIENPLGVGAQGLHKWLLGTKTFQSLHGGTDGRGGVDDEFAALGFENIGAWIMGRNMFGPVRGPWPDESWRGWWGESPPYHVPVFVLTHHTRRPLEMEGGNIFHFVTGGIDEALARAKEAAKGKDIRLGGGAATIRQYLERGLIDEMHLVLSPVILGRGENLLEGMDLKKLGFRISKSQTTENGMHVIISK
jgi:dihydrofolate reductase